MNLQKSIKIKIYKYNIKNIQKICDILMNKI